MLNEYMDKSNGHLVHEWLDDYVTYAILYIVVTKNCNQM